MRNHTAAFVPPFCPRSSCVYHLHSSGWRFKKIGFHTRLAAPHRVQRFICCSCKRSFSSQTFSVSYWLKRPDLLPPLFHLLLGCSGYRQLGRSLGVSHTTVMRLAERLGRHCLLFQQQFRPQAVLDEPLAVDGSRPSSTASTSPATSTSRSAPDRTSSTPSPTVSCGARGG